MNIDFSDIVDDRLTGKTPLECAKRVELRMLRIFDRVCKTYGLSYCLAYGTLLGAVRHGGFIPWDDDIDVHMPLDDYEKFMKIAADVLPKEIGFYHGKDTQCGFGKIVDRCSLYLDETVQAFAANYPRGIFIDIFPLRRYRSRILHEKTTMWVRHGKLRSLPEGRITLVNLLRKWFWKSLNTGFRFLDFLNSSKDGRWAGVPQYMWGSSIMLPEWPFPPSSVKFEGFDFPAPHSIDKYLTAIYGGYMELPPLEKRFVHAKIIVPSVSK